MSDRRRYHILIDVIVEAEDDIEAIVRLQEALLFEADGKESGYAALPDVPGSVNLIECELDIT